MKKTRFEELVEEFCEIICGLGDYDWDHDFGKSPKCEVIDLTKALAERASSRQIGG